MVAEWLREYWFEIFLAFAFAIVAGYAYEKIKPKPKIERKTIVRKKESSVLARLILPNNNEIKIKEFEREKIFGREDFFGAIPADDLQFIGRRHFIITKKIDESGKSEWYIKDFGTKNGTKLNGNDIKKEEGLLHNAIISVAGVVDLTFKIGSSS